MRCGLLNHIRENCRYKFSAKCYKCKSFHAHFLCFDSSKAKPKGNNSKDTKKTTAEISVNVVNFSVMNACRNSINIIPTFTANFESQPNVSARCMYDTAAQTSFITENVFKKLNCEVIKSKISVNIVGFNEYKQVDSKLVKLVTRMKRCSRSFNAIVVTEIWTKITGKFNPIVQAFEKAQLPLADKNLGKSSTVGILIGIDAAHMHFACLFACFFFFLINNLLCIIYLLRTYDCWQLESFEI